MPKKKPGSKFSYELTVIYKGYAYVVKPEDIGDWYDVAVVESLLDKILERSGSSKRFNAIDTEDQMAQYIFGVPSIVEEVLRKYKL